MRQRVMETLRAQFRPEFLNRVDEVIIFHSLSREQIMQIVDIQMRSLRQRLEERHMTGADRGRQGVPGGARASIPTYGARP